MYPPKPFSSTSRARYQSMHGIVCFLHRILKNSMRGKKQTHIIATKVPYTNSDSPFRVLDRLSSD